MTQHHRSSPLPRRVIEVTRGRNAVDRTRSQFNLMTSSQWQRYVVTGPVAMPTGGRSLACQSPPSAFVNRHRHRPAGRVAYARPPHAGQGNRSTPHRVIGLQRKRPRADFFPPDTGQEVPPAESPDGSAAVLRGRWRRWFLRTADDILDAPGDHQVPSSRRRTLNTLQVTAFAGYHAFGGKIAVRRVGPAHQEFLSLPGAPWLTIGVDDARSSAGRSGRLGACSTTSRWVADAGEVRLAHSAMPNTCCRPGVGRGAYPASVTPGF